MTTEDENHEGVDFTGVLLAVLAASASNLVSSSNPELKWLKYLRDPEKLDCLSLLPAHVPVMVQLSHRQTDIGVWAGSRLSTLMEDVEFRIALYNSDIVWTRRSGDILRTVLNTISSAARSFEDRELEALVSLLKEDRLGEELYLYLRLTSGQSRLSEKALAAIDWENPVFGHLSEDPEVKAKAVLEQGESGSVEEQIKLCQSIVLDEAGVRSLIRRHRELSPDGDNYSLSKEIILRLLEAMDMPLNSVSQPALEYVVSVMGEHGVPTQAVIEGLEPKQSLPLVANGLSELLTRSLGRQPGVVGWILASLEPETFFGDSGEAFLSAAVESLFDKNSGREEARKSLENLLKTHSPENHVALAGLVIRERILPRLVDLESPDKLPHQVGRFLGSALRYKGNGASHPLETDETILALCRFQASQTAMQALMCVDPARVLAVMTDSTPGE